MHVHLVSLHRISADTGAGGFILPREIVAAAQEGSTFFGSFFPSGKKEHKRRQSVAIAYGERRTFSGDHATCGANNDSIPHTQKSIFFSKMLQAADKGLALTK